MCSSSSSYFSTRLRKQVGSDGGGGRRRRRKGRKKRRRLGGDVEERKRAERVCVCVWWQRTREGRRKEERLFPRATTWYTLTLFVPDACRRRSSNSGRTSGLPSLFLFLSLSPGGRCTSIASLGAATPLHSSSSFCSSGLFPFLSALLMDMLNYFSRFAPSLSLSLPPARRRLIDRDGSRR